jgi:hypothetical protein
MQVRGDVPKPIPFDVGRIRATQRMASMSFNTIPEIIEDIRAGRMV